MEHTRSSYPKSARLETISSSALKTHTRIAGAPTEGKTLDLSIAMPKESNAEKVLAARVHEW